MASLVQELIQLLEEETGCYNLLRDMADNKKDVIIQGDLPSLQDMTQREQEMAGLLLRLEKKRMAIIEDIAVVTNQDKEAMTVKHLITLLDGQPEQQALEAVSEKLIEAVTPLKEANKTNEMLLKQSLDYVDFTMNAIQSTREPVATNNYHKKGYNAGSYGAQSLFDSKQ